MANNNNYAEIYKCNKEYNFSEKNYSKNSDTGIPTEELNSYSTECDKLIVYQRNFIQQQQCLIDILSGMFYYDFT